MAKLLLVSAAAALVLGSPAALAQLTGPNIDLSQGLPQPVTDVLDTAKRINLGIQELPFIQRIVDRFQGTDLTDVSSGNIFSDIANLWNRVNDWFDETIGVSLRDILVVLGNLFVWLLGLIIKLLQAALNAF